MKEGGIGTQEDNHQGKNLTGCGLPGVLNKRIPERESEGRVTED